MQLYRSSVPNDLFVRVYQCFGYEKLNQEYMFSKADLERLNTVENMIVLRNELCQYYIPCKAKLYLSNLNELKCITVFRQLLRLNNIVLVSKQKYVKHKKITFYSIQFEKNEKHDICHSMKVNNGYTILSFS